MINRRLLTVPDILPLVRGFYQLPGNEVGGVLHIVLDDGNIEDQHIEYCLSEAIAKNDMIAVSLAKLLLKMTYTQRKKIYMNWDN